MPQLAKEINTLFVITTSVFAFKSVRFSNFIMEMRRLFKIYCLFALVCLGSYATKAQEHGPYDTIMVGGLEMNGVIYPHVFLADFETHSTYMSPEERKRIGRLRYNISVTYYYALTASTVFSQIHKDITTMDRRRDKKQYLKKVDKELDAVFKTPLKNLAVDQGHVLIRLIQRQTGQNCYDIIKEVKGGMSAMFWQSAGVFFNNNLNKDYDPNGEDRDIERLARELEESANYRYQLIMQAEMMKKITKR